jgi:hypothetical protein
MKIILILLILPLSIFSQNGWSVPVQLSEVGIFPDTLYLVPAITRSNNGTIHTFWIKNIQPEGEYLDWISQIEYRYSLDNGDSWSDVQNLTPDFSSIVERIREMKVVCDSENNIHLVFLQGYENCKVKYMYFNGTTWSEPTTIHDYAVATGYSLKLGIDHEDRLYAIWYKGNAAYMYKDDNWSTTEYILEGGQYFIRDFKINSQNEIIGVGNILSGDPLIFKYSKLNEQWFVESMFSPADYNGAQAIAITDTDTLFVNISVGNIVDVNQNYLIKKHKDGTNWSSPEYINQNTWSRTRAMYADQNSNLHLFESNYGSGRGVIQYSVRENHEWSSYDILCDEYYRFSDYNVYFDKNNDTFYLIYKKYCTHEDGFIENPTIYFTTKKVETDIENENILSSCIISQNYPNPFNPATVINFSLDKKQSVNLSVFNSKGELIQTLFKGTKDKGNHSVNFYAANLNSGVYFYKLTLDGKSQTKKMLYLR